MNQDYVLFIAIVFFIPLVISPITIDAQKFEDEEISVVVQFEYPVGLSTLKSDVEENYYPSLNQTLINFVNNQNYTGYTIDLEENHHVYFLEYNSETGNGIYELDPQVMMTFEGNLTNTEFETERNILLFSLRNDLLDFLNNNNATSIISFMDFSWGTLKTNES